MEAILEMFQNIFGKSGLTLVSEIFAEIKAAFAKIFGAKDAE